MRVVASCGPGRRRSTRRQHAHFGAEVALGPLGVGLSCNNHPRDLGGGGCAARGMAEVDVTPGASRHTGHARGRVTAGSGRRDIYAPGPTASQVRSAGQYPSEAIRDAAADAVFAPKVRESSLLWTAPDTPFDW